MPSHLLMDVTTNFLGDHKNHVSGAHSIAIGPDAGVFGIGEVAIWMPLSDGNLRRFLFKPNGSVWIGYDPRRADVCYMRIQNPGMVVWVNMELRAHINKTWPKTPILTGEKWFEMFTDGTKVNVAPYTSEVEAAVTWAKEYITATSQKHAAEEEEA